MKHSLFYKKEQLNPILWATNSIAVRFDTIAKTFESVILSQIRTNDEKHVTVLKIISEPFGKHVDVINH